jgi:hypothetical protein
VTQQKLEFMNTGQKTIEWLYSDQLRVDPKWSIKDANGFTWWADRNAQRVEVRGTERNENGDDVYFIGVETEFLRNVAPNAKSLAALHALLMSSASMAGPVYVEETQTVKLCSLVAIHEVIRAWMSPIISMACTLQIAEARIMGPELARTLGAEAAETWHPQNGFRPEPDELAEIVPAFVAPLGREPCKWTEEEFESVVEEYMQQLPSLCATSGGLGFTVEFPYGDFSSLCRVKGDEPHPRYGNGLLLIQSFPVRNLSEEDGIRLALSLNAMELGAKPFGYGFGSYCFRDSTIHFTAFLPNALYRRGLLHNIYFASAARARAMSWRLLKVDWNRDDWDRNPPLSVLVQA